MNIKSTVMVLFALMFSLTAVAEANKTDIEPFYDFLSNPSSEVHASAFTNSITSQWKSIGDYSGKSKSSDQFVKQVKGFGQLIPDLKWSIQEVVVESNKVVVRSRATGTPQGPLFGVDGQGKSFDILTIDIHTLKNGKIIESYHVEDWAGALQQLSGR